MIASQPTGVATAGATAEATGVATTRARATGDRGQSGTYKSFTVT